MQSPYAKAIPGLLRTECFGGTRLASHVPSLSRAESVIIVLIIIMIIIIIVMIIIVTFITIPGLSNFVLLQAAPRTDRAWCSA